jgi:hypothetical protein
MREQDKPVRQTYRIERARPRKSSQQRTRAGCAGEAQGVRWQQDAAAGWCPPPRPAYLACCLYFTGPLIRVRGEVWLCLLESTQVSDTVAPGLYLSITPVRPLAVVTDWPLTPVITSPARTPAW